MTLTPTGRIRQDPPMQNIPVRTAEGARIRAALTDKLETSMGEMAEAALWAELHGIDPSDMSPEDWVRFYEEMAIDVEDLATSAAMLLGDLDALQDEEAPPGRAAALHAVVPEFSEEEATQLVALLEKLEKASAPQKEGPEDRA